jgi:predicted ribosome quality control (RQC) complex YloA/Tae2 family protein
MEGLFIAKILEDLEAQLPARNLGWAFPNETTASLLLEPVSGSKQVFNLVLTYRPPTPALYLNRERVSGGPVNPFQRLLETRLKGNLIAASQWKLDRVAMLEFAASEGFVSTAPARLVFELTGRNANLLLLEGGGSGDGQTAFEGRITAPAREVTAERNRFRTVRTGGQYHLPPPYEKLDPRTATDAELHGALDSLPVSKWAGRVDGLGPTLTRELEFRAERLGDGVLALRDLVRDPSLSASESLSEQAQGRSRDDRVAQTRKSLREPLEKRLKLLEKQLEDVTRAQEAALDAIGWREWADTLLAFRGQVPAGVLSVRLPNLYGEGEIEIPLEPDLDAAQNANRLYSRAKRREEVNDRLAVREPELRAQKTQVEGFLHELETAGETRLEALLQQNADATVAPPPVGIRYRTRGGYDVLVGRNSKENDFLTFRLASSLDVWFHVQGYPGSHAVLRAGNKAGNKEVPFSDILEAAAVAAWHSKARGSTSVAVDYMLKKFVWKPRGARAGAVYFTHQKTVIVEPGVPETGGVSSGRAEVVR